MHHKILWQNYQTTIEKILTPKSTHLELVYYSVAWLKSHYKSFQPIEQQQILTNPIFDYNFAEYATENQAFTAWETFHHKENKDLNWFVDLCFNAVYPTLTLECDCCDYGVLRPITDGFGNIGYYCDNCNESFVKDLTLAPDEDGKPMTLKILQDNSLDKFLRPNPLKTKRP